MSELLDHGHIELLGRHPEASNAVFVVTVTDATTSAHAIYKPIAGERELWDFPGGALARREVAAYEFATALGFSLIPRTVWREEAPHGPGSLQLWIEQATIPDTAVASVVEPGWLKVLDAKTEDGTPVIVAHRDTADLRAVAFLDALMNNADRKAGHLLRDTTGQLSAVDHGVCFHADPKLRTVLWGFSGQPFSEALTRALMSVPDALPVLDPWITGAEIDALQARADALLGSGVYPAPTGEWPAIPWPIW